MNLLHISHSSERFDIRPHVADLIAAHALNRCVMWHRDGMTGLIHPEVLGNALDLFHSYETMRQRGRITELPAAAYTITWDQCFDVQCESDTD
jgi:hypothetical protein